MEWGRTILYFKKSLDLVLELDAIAISRRDAHAAGVTEEVVDRNCDARKEVSHYRTGSFDVGNFNEQWDAQHFISPCLKQLEKRRLQTNNLAYNRLSLT